MSSFIPKQPNKDPDQITIKLDRDVLQKPGGIVAISTPAATTPSTNAWHSFSAWIAGFTDGPRPMVRSTMTPRLRRPLNDCRHC